MAQQARRTVTPTESAAAVRAQTPMRGRALPDAYVPGGPAVKISSLVNVPLVVLDVGPEKIGGQFNKPMADFTFQRIPDYTSGDDTEYRCVTGSGPLLEQLARLRGKLPALVCIGQKESPNPRFGPYYTLVDPADYRENDDVQITSDDLAQE